jgi:hypothetical protein
LGGDLGILGCWAGAVDPEVGNFGGKVKFGSALAEVIGDSVVVAAIVRSDSSLDWKLRETRYDERGVVAMVTWSLGIFG